MKNILFTLMLFLASIIAKSQTTPVANYVFSQNEGTYTEISGGTTHGNETNNEESFNAIDIGFTFNYNGVDYTQISIQTNGFIAMGTTVIATPSPISTTSGTNNVVSALGSGLAGQTGSELMSKTEGSAPNRVFTVQWKNYTHSFYGGNVNFQIKLYETNNKIELIYGQCSTGHGEYIPAQVGLRGNSTSDFNSRRNKYNYGEHYAWTETRKSTSASLGCILYSGRAPESGLTFTYQAPQTNDCGITSVTTPDNVLSSVGTENLTVELTNFGTATLTSATIKWQVNEGTINTYNWTGSLNQYSAEEVTIGTVDFSSENYININVWTENPNGTSDDITGNNLFSSHHTVNQYCSSNLTNDDWYYIEQVTIGNLKHYYCYASGTYSSADYSYNFNANHTPGENLNYQVDANSGGYVAFWIDENDNNVFEDTEWLGTSSFFAYNEIGSGTITIPADAPEGMHKLRVRYITATEGGIVPGAGDACTPLTSFAYEGDCHDYAINVYNPNTAPPCASMPTPTNNSTNVFINETLEWESTDATNFDVYFGTSSNPPFVQNQPESFYEPDLMDDNTTYYWKIIAKNEYGDATGCETWQFTTGENAEYCTPPVSDCDEWWDNIDNFYMEDLIHENSGCSPYGYGDFTDGTYTTNLIQGANVTWSADYGSQDALAIWIDFNDDGTFNETDEFVYHTELVDGNFVHIETDNFTLPSDCNLGTHRMRVRCSADIYEFEGDQACASTGYSETHDYIVTIIDATEPPECATNPIPENDAIDMPRNQQLAWLASAATSYDVYFGTTELELAGEVFVSEFNPDILDANLTYIWQIIPKNGAGEATNCPTWTFTTGELLDYCTENLYYGDYANSPCDWGDYIEDFYISNFAMEGFECAGGYNVADSTHLIINFEQGATYTWTAELDITNSDYIAIWMDADDNGNFEADELLYTADEFFPTSTATGIITIPAITPLGGHRFRVRTKGTGEPIGADQACTQFAYGQAYDFTANISEPSSIPECAVNPFPANGATNQNQNLGDLTWACDFATEFDVYFGTDANPPLVSENQTTANYQPGVLDANTTYYWKVIPYNSIGGPTDCDVWSFTTNDEISYCTILYTGDEFGEICAWGDYIDDFILDDFEHLGTDCENTDGFEDFTDMTFDLEKGQTYSWTVTTGNSNFNHLAIWIDYNDDGEFNNSDEFIYSTENLIPLSFSDTLSILSNAPNGEHRFRIRLKSQEPSMTGDDACTIYTWGETHDYTVNITGIDEVADNFAKTTILYPNPATNYVTVSSDYKIKKVQIFDVTGKMFAESSHNSKECELNTSGLKAGFYIVKIVNSKKQIITKKLIKK